jgi:threonine/homoserine/homoserine lactone efflux protein|tara:strand:+ start:967 stop:1620 length:654 start_codon:yes stop_codon:yes gene_type:complete
LEVVIAFGVAVFFSFIGSVFLGLVNAAVIETAINRSEKSALWLAFGGVLPEIPYTLIAIFGTSYIAILEGYKMEMSIGMGIVFILIGLSYMLKKKKEVKAQNSIETGALANFSKGFLLAIANPQLIFYWSGYLIVFQTGTFSNGKPFFTFTDSVWDPTKWSFAIGASAGAFLILFIYIKLSSIYKDQLVRLIGDKLSHIIGLVFIIMGIFTILSNAI